MRLDGEKLATKISESTLIPLSLVSLVVVISVYIARLGDRVDVQAAQISELQSAVKTTARFSERVDKRLFRIEEHMGVKHIEDPSN